MRKTTWIMLTLAALTTAPWLAASADPTLGEARLQVDEFTVEKDTWCQITREWVDDLLATHEEGTWAPMMFRPTDDQLRRIGLPPADVLKSQRYAQPTMVLPDGGMVPLATEELNLAVASYAGTGCLGIRPGAWLLLIDEDGIGWCSLAHAYGSPGSYKISTAGHCGKTGTIATVIAAVGNFQDDRMIGTGAPVPILLDFGKFSSSTDGGIGNDKALITVFPEFQHLVSPTMCFWGGPLGSFTKTGAVLSAQVVGKNGRLDPKFATNPDPFLVQPILHYGHGTGLGPGGTPRAGLAQHWDADHFAFFGAISPGDSGSGSNTAGGDTIGAANEAAGINTHIYVDPSLKTGIGLMAGTRVPKVGTPAPGQIAPYPAPFPLGP